ncbi:MAG: choice-of-anchor D domain-containing protein, partial [Gammaproteobacteria bacterium]|nr:choice-of-anchor D domain-containing protein [Gammaproteobacteria bacterium]
MAMHNNSKSLLIKLGLATSVLLLASGTSLAQQQVNLTAAPAVAAMPDGSAVPMWGYSCGAAVSGSTASCAKLNSTATGWSPVVITVPTGQGLTVNLTNNLPASVPETSLVIVGQLGGGLGSTASATPSPPHATQDTTWPIAAAGPTNTPPPQGSRVQSFATPVGPGATAALTWNTLKPGTYLFESGTHPSIQGSMGLYGILVVTTAPAGSSAGVAYGTGGTATAVTYNAEIPLLLSEIDPVQNNAVNTAVNTPGFSETRVWSGQPGGCGNPGSPVGVVNTCYPPAVNYTPLYYMINGVAFSKSSASASLFPTIPATGVTGNVLVRLVNAGLRMHVPSIVGAQTTPPVVATGTTAVTVPGLSLIAEDGNPLPGVSRVQNEVFLAAGKTYDVMIDAPAAGASALPVYDRELSLSGNSTARDAGMLAYIGTNGAGVPAATSLGTAVARDDTYNAVVAGQTLTVSDPAKGLIANDTNVYGVQLVGTVPGLTLNPNGTFTYSGAPTTFTYCANGTVTGTTCSSNITATVSLNASNIVDGGIICTSPTYSANTSTYLAAQTPGLLAGCKDGANLPLTVDTSSVTAPSGLTVVAAADGGFIATANVAAPSYTFTFKAKNSQGALSAATNATVNFAAPTGIQVNLVDGVTKAAVTDYRWIIEEDRTFYINPRCTTNPPPAGCVGGGTVVPTFGTNFHTSYMPVVAAGCTGPLSCESGQSVSGNPVVCDVGNGICRSGSQQVAVDPSTVHLDPTKRYYISVLPGDAANSFENLNGCLGNATPSCGHGMGGAPIACVPAPGAVACTASTGAFPTSVNVIVQPNPFPPSKLSVFVFEDDFPLNGEQDGGGGVDVLSPNEPGLGGFNITLFDDAGGTGDATGQMTYDMFNMPLANGLAGTIDPATGQDACPVSGANQNLGFDGTTSPTGITGTIVTCPKYEKDGKTLSPLAGQAVISNLMPGRYGVVATPGADRIGRGEEWLQTNTLDGQKAHDSFLRIGEPSFFQEYGPAGFHVSIGFANPQIINDRKAYICNGTDPNSPQPGTSYTCNNSVTGTVTTERMSRTPDERLYSSGDNSSFAFTQCYVSFGDPDGEDFAFTKCDANGNFTLSGLPEGDWRITVFDQWNDMLVDGLSTPVRLGGGATVNLGQIATNQWQANLYTTSFLDTNGNGVRDPGEPGLSLVSTNIRFRDGSYSNFNNTDLSGNAGFNEVFPLFSWYVVEGYSTRYKTTGTHVVYDAGGPADGSGSGASGACTDPTAPCGTSSIAAMLANTAERIPVPSALRVPGAFYCAKADCADAAAPFAGGGAGGSTGRIDPPNSFGTEGWQGFSGQNSFIEFGKKPYAPGETGGIFGEVTYASTRPFDDPALLIHTSWTPNVPNVTINLYQEGVASDGVTPTLTLVDTTKTTSWDDWAQGFRSDGNPNMNCPGQGTSTGTNGDLFFFSLYNQPNWLDEYNNGGTPAHTLPNNSQFKCYDGMHNWNQVQPAPYDGMYSFPSVTGRDPTTGHTTGTNCTICVKNNDQSDSFRFGKEDMLPPGKYVVEVVVPPGYELVKEEDKNILIGDNYIAPVTQQFAGLGSVFIMPDQAEVNAYYNANNPQNPTNALGRTNFPSGEGDTGSVESFWPCVGQARIVPDYISLFPQSHEVAPFAGAVRNLCDRKEVTLKEQTAALAKFWIFSSTHVAAHFTGVITDDYTSEFDPFSPQFGEKFSPPDLPVSIKDWSGTEISRVYADHWGAYNGLTYSTWEVNPPNPTGYAPTMMVTCMNDPGTGPAPDPLYNPQYSQFCYEIPFMPGQTQYMDTPVVPTSAFAGAGYNNPDCAYPALTPAIAEVDGDGVGPWVSQAGPSHTLTIKALGDQLVPNNAYSGPSATTAPYNQKTVLRHYGFGASQGGGSVTIGGINAPVTFWSDTQITVTVPGGVPNCPVQQQAQYGGSSAQCGQLQITAANGQQSIDTVTVTIGGKAPTHVAASGSIQAAIDAAMPGDLLIIDPTCTSTAAATAGTRVACSKSALDGTTPTQSAGQAAHQEMVLMWKPVRLQGVGAASSVINANTHPAGEAKLSAWRARVNCLFGLGLTGSPSDWNKSCASGWFGFNASANAPQVDRLPLEAAVGWDASQNGNLAELLQEPALMGALEGAGITVLGKGLDFHGQSPWSDATETGSFPAGTHLLQDVPEFLDGNGDELRRSSSHCTDKTNPFPSNFMCNPSSIDGLTITDSSQGGGGIFVHGWGHNLQIANNRIYNNAGTLSGGINLGQGEHPEANTYQGINTTPDTCQPGTVAGLAEPFCFDMNVNIHHNSITQNSSTGDELFSATPAGAGGVSICNGSDYYKFNYNWVCGNLSSGDGGGVAHIGLNWNGDIEHNAILFNQSTNPTIATNGGGLLIMGAPDADPACGAANDIDCVPTPGSVLPSDGAGPGLVINANLIMGNQAESGSGGGLAFQHVNGTDVINFPDGTRSVRFPGISARISPWYSPLVTNNIIVNNVAGWDGGGVSLLDALSVDIINNTIMSNDSTASSGMLFDTLGAPRASTQGPSTTTSGTTTSAPQPAGLVSIPNSTTLTANFPKDIVCPTNHGVGSTHNDPRINGACRTTSFPALFNDVIYGNRSFFIGVGALGGGTQNQQNVVTLFNAVFPPTAPSTATPAASQAATGACPTASYWDIGVRGDTGPTNHGSTVTLTPEASFLTSTAGYAGGGTGFRGNSQANPAVVSQYCNGSRIPPEFNGSGWQVPPGIADATVPNPLFNLTPAATVDEGNNWVNIAWGPLAQTHPVTGATLGNYAPAAGSPVINYVTNANSTNTYGPAPTVDFFGTQRKTNGSVDVGAVEFVAPPGAILSVTPTSLAFGNVPKGQTSAPQTLTLSNTGTLGASGISVAVTAPFSRAGGTCGATLAGGSTCTITIVFAPSSVTASTGTATITASVTVTGSPVSLSGTGVAAVAAATLTPTAHDFGTHARTCPGTSVPTRIACALEPVQMFTLTNTGNVTLTGIGQGVLGGKNTADFAIRPLLSTCG